MSHKNYWEERKKDVLIHISQTCIYCNEIVRPGHECYIPNYQSTENVKLPCCTFFDFEGRFDTI